MRVFSHHLYEYSKGLRRLILHTTKAEYRDRIVAKLEQKGIAHILECPAPNKINVFFGDRDCIEVLKSFPHLNLNELSIDQDFILGAMLGYDIRVQCRRYLRFIQGMAQKEAV